MVTTCGAERLIGLPTIIQYAAAGWLPLACVIDRMMAHLSATRAERGKCSLIRIPLTLVSMGRNVPRISSGASGFRSHMSRCEGPPERKSRITERARGRAGADAEA